MSRLCLFFSFIVQYTIFNQWFLLHLQQNIVRIIDINLDGRLI